ncbi:MAG: S-layer homology domain-containing protein [Syntrophomonadaceae bacterium]|nr:S-layer homology domain-containing protein [Syntrophomonadaceae bacterium]
MKLYQRIISIVIIIILVVSLSTKDAVAYNDIDNHWAYGNIMAMSMAGHLKGYPDGTFRPDQVMTRAEFVTLLMSCLKIKSSANYSTISSHWAQPQIEQAIKHGIIITSEYPYGPIPDQAINRAEIAALTVRCLQMSPVYGSLPFNDGEVLTGNPYYGYIYTAYSEGLLSGYPSGDFRPDSQVTRAQAATICSRLLYQISKNKICLNDSSGEKTDYLLPDSANVYYENIRIDNRNYSPAQVQILRGSTAYDWDEIEILSRNRIKLGNNIYDIDAANIRIKFGRETKTITSMYYNANNRQLVVATEEDDYIDKSTIFFYLDNVKTSWDYEEVAVYLEGSYRYLDNSNIYFIDDNRLQWFDEIYTLINRTLKYDENRYNIIDTDWDEKANRYKIYVEN